MFCDIECDFYFGGLEMRHETQIDSVIIQYSTQDEHRSANILHIQTINHLRFHKMSNFIYSVSRQFQTTKTNRLFPFDSGLNDPSNRQTNKKRTYIEIDRKYIYQQANY